MADNLTLYNKVCVVPKGALKSFNNGKFSGTDINPMWRIKTLTKEFGACGIGWYYTIDRQWTEDGHDGRVCVFVNVSLYIKDDGEWSKPIQGTGGNMLINKFSKGLDTSDEAYKMALTDALSIACKALGIGADVWWKEGKTKYTNQEPLNYQSANDVQAEPTGQTGWFCDKCNKKVTEKVYDFKGLGLCFDCQKEV